MPEDLYRKMRVDCWNKALFAAGTSYIYSKRISSIKWQVSWSKALGIALPVLLGGMVGTYYQYREVMEWAIAVSSPIALAQLVFSTILTVNNVENNLVKYADFSTKNSLLCEEYERLAKYPPESFSELQAKFDLLSERERNIRAEEYDLSDKEKRMGMRYGLRQYERACVKCDQVPYSMKATNCPVCGNF